MKNFQIIALGLFIFFIVIGVATVALLGRFGGGSDTTTARASVWGTLPEEYVEGVVRELNTGGNQLQIQYREIREDDFDSTLVEALASGIGPDAILLSDDLILRHQDKVFPIPSDILSERDFKDTFIEEGELYLTQDGILGLPFSVDPLVMFWNRTLFSDESIANPPRFWDEFIPLTARLTERDSAGNITQSTVALGEYRNISHAKEIIATLIMQAGNPIIDRGGTGGSVRVILSDSLGLPISPAEASLRFYTEFSNPVKEAYSWNRALPLSKNAFIAGDVAVYFGRASELFEIQEKNPNLNFDVAVMPQARDVTGKRTFGRMHALALLKSSRNIAESFNAIFALVGSDAVRAWSDITGLPPVRRDLLSERQSDAFRSVFYDSAIIAGAFLDPERAETDVIFREMVEDITSGRLRVGESIRNADGELEFLLE